MTKPLSCPRKLEQIHFSYAEIDNFKVMMEPYLEILEHLRFFPIFYESQDFIPKLKHAGWVIHGWDNIQNYLDKLIQGKQHWEK